MLTLRPTGFLLVSSLTLLACGSEDNDGSPSAGGTGASGGTGGDGGVGGGTGGTAPVCAKGPGYKTQVAPVQVNSFVGKLADLDGNPAVDTLTTVCGVDVCSELGSTDADGTVITCDKQLNLCSPGINPGFPLIKPAFKYALGMQYAKFALLLPPGSSDFDVGTQLTAKFPPFSAGQPLVAGAEATSGPATVIVEPGSTIKYDLDFQLGTEEERRFRAVEIPMTNAPDAVDPTLGFAWVVATTPVETHFCPNAKLVLSNTGSLAAGSSVELWIHGVDTGEEWAPYGEWGKVSDATVSADGLTIETVEGQGIAVLGTYGVRPKP